MRKIKYTKEINGKDWNSWNDKTSEKLKKDRMEEIKKITLKNDLGINWDSEYGKEIMDTYKDNVHKFFFDVEILKKTFMHKELVVEHEREIS